MMWLNFHSFESDRIAMKLILANKDDFWAKHAIMGKGIDMRL